MQETLDGFFFSLRRSRPAFLTEAIDTTRSKQHQNTFSAEIWKCQAIGPPALLVLPGQRKARPEVKPRGGFFVYVARTIKWLYRKIVRLFDRTFFSEHCQSGQDEQHT